MAVTRLHLNLAQRQCPWGGGIDPAIIEYLCRVGKVDVHTVQEWLNKRLGLKGVSGVSPGTRVLIERTDARSQLALDMFAYRVRKCIGAYLAVRNGADAIVSAGGIVENTEDMRRRICDGLSSLGLDLDHDLASRMNNREGRISNAGSRLEAWVIPTEESLMIARLAFDFLP